MNKLISSSLYVVALVMLLLTACNTQDNNFRVNGQFTSADGEVLYLEHRSLAGLELVDSTKLNEKGSFKFKETAPDNPEFYQLRLNNQVVIFAIDSTETVTINADASDLHNTYTIEPVLGNKQIKQVIDMQQTAKVAIADLVVEHDNNTIDDVTFMQSVDSILNVYKDFAQKIILGNPSSAAAYYAVFQKIDDYLIFDPYNKKDYPMFGAVATSWNRFYPETQRTKHLYDFTMNALRTRKQQEKQSEFMSDVVVEESQLPDISLPNVKGEKISLSTLRDKYVLLDFTAYKTDFSLSHNAKLEQIYNKYKAKGFEIYQISFDSDTHFWKNVAVELPWTTVYDATSINSTLLRSYNVRELPTGYIINKDGDIIMRIDNIDELEDKIGQLF